MTIQERTKQSWTRKHDLPGAPRFPTVPVTLYPESGSLKDLIDRCKSPARQHMHAAGSHWALSEAAFSDHTYIETHDTHDFLPAMSRTLYDVIPGCMTQQFIDTLASRTVLPYDADPAHVRENEGLYLVHVETGKRIYQLYAELDLGDDDPQSLATLLKGKTGGMYSGPWAFATLGGAGGQTVFGALTTGTHGGDFEMPPLADSVMAMHLVADGGKHYWIEPESTGGLPRLTDDQKLRDRYGPVSGNPNDFVILRDDTVFRAVLVSAGRFGIVYSVVLKAVRQYSLHEEVRLTNTSGEILTWQVVRGLIGTLTGPLYQKPSDPANGTDDKNRFLQIAVCLTPFENFQKNRVSITKRWNVELTGPDPVTPFGRNERRGEPPRKPDGTLIIDPLIQGPRFQNAGTTQAYSPTGPSFLEKACADANFMDGLVQEIHDAIHDLLHNHTVAGGLAGAAIIGGAEALAPLLPLLAIFLLLLEHFLDDLRKSAKRLGQAMDIIRDLLLDRSDPGELTIGTYLWHAIAYKVFEALQGEHDFSAISYAVMDRHDYVQQSCDVNVESVEVFFAADDPMLIAFIDALISFEIHQEAQGLAFLGYASLRFTGQTRALLGMQTHPMTCAVEVAGLKDVKGTSQLVEFAIALARNPNFRGILHWGQRNDFTMADIQERFGDRLAAPSGPLHQWRSALSRITGNGRLGNFSNAFTRRTGLEIVSPAIGSLTVVPLNTVVNNTVLITWDCEDNPSAVDIAIDIIDPTGTPTPHPHQTRFGQLQFSPTRRGTYTVRLTAVLTVNQESRSDQRSLNVVVT